MTPNATTSLAAAELAIYLILTPLIIYLLYFHRLPGLLGWVYLQIFSVLRLVAAGIQIANRNKSTSITGDIISSVGLSPLLLAFAGILHEASHYLQTIGKRKVSFIVQLSFHIVAVGGVVLLALGGSKLADPETHGNKYSTDHALQETGAVILFLVWIALCVYAFLILWQARAYTEIDGQLKAAGRLLQCCITALPFVGIRATYTVIYSFDHSSHVNPITGYFALKLILVAIVQLISVLALVFGGVLSRNVAAKEGDRVIRDASSEGANESFLSSSEAHQMSSVRK